MILLDTPVLIWLVAEQNQLSKNAKDAIAQSAGRIFVSSISAYEIGILVNKKLLTLPHEPQHWFSEALDLHGLNELPIDHHIALQATQLPQLHQNPIDRMLLASAILHNLQLITSDQQMHQYPTVKCVW